jgi:8-oxo-dGTP pyrophosphatase MutT (NUDIX family)
MASLFPHRLPESRLGESHVTLADFQKEIQFTPSKTKEYSLIMVTEPKTQRILLGRKHRGFGAGLLNSFGGKLEPNEPILSCAVRELEEETGIRAEERDLLKTGTLHFTIHDDPLKMLVHVYRLNVDCSKDENSPLFKLDPSAIRGCEEITPEWIENWHQIPLQEMFADDSLWLTTVLATSGPIYVEGYFHFEAGGQDVNSIRHYWMDVQPSTPIAKKW